MSVDPVVLKDLDGADERLAAARSHAYRVLVAAFDYPVDDVLETIRSGDLAQAIGGVLASVDPALTTGLDFDVLSDAGADDELAIEYTRLFDAGAGGPPCPLYGGLYGGARMKVMEEAVRFYNFFGLHLSDAPRELPDHVTTQLEFMHFLSYRETEALHRGEDPDSFRRAQRDFLSRSLGAWVPKLRQRLDQHKPMPFFTTVVEALHRFIEHERDHLLASVGPPRPGAAS